MNLRSKRSTEKVEEPIRSSPKRKSSVKNNDSQQKKFKSNEIQEEEKTEKSEKKTVLAQKSQRYKNRREPPTPQGFVSVAISDSDDEVDDEKEDEEEQLASSHHKRYIVFNTNKNDQCMRTFGVQKNPYYIGPVVEATLTAEKPEDDECIIVEKEDEVILIPDDDEDNNGVEEVPTTVQIETDITEFQIPKTVLSLKPPADDSSLITEVDIPNPQTTPPPENVRRSQTDCNTSVTKMNTLVTKKITELQKAQNLKIDTMVNPGVGRILISTYMNFLSWFTSGKIHIWKTETDGNEGYFVVTSYKSLPVIDNIVGILNIKAEKNRSSLPVIFQLILSEATSSKLNKLSVILTGFSHYWVIRGFSCFEKNLTSANAIKILPETHPVLTKKIEKLHNIIVDQEVRIRNDIQKSNPNIAVPSQLVNQTSQPVIQSPQTMIQSPNSVIQVYQSSINFDSASQKDLHPHFPEHSKSSEMESAKSQLLRIDKQLVSSKKQVATALLNKTPDSHKKQFDKEMDHFIQSQSFKNIKFTNIMRRQITSDELSKIHLPVYKDYEHRWYIIDFKDDFSYMYIPESNEFLSHHRLQKSASQSNYKNKVVQLSLRRISNFNCFVTPPSLSYLYMGPFSGNAKLPVVVLLSLVNGVIVPRQESPNVYGSVTTSFIISVGENGIECPSQVVQVDSVIQKETNTIDEVSRLVGPQTTTSIQPKVFKNLFDTSSKTTNIGHITIQKLSVSAGGVAKISIPQNVAVDTPYTSEHQVTESSGHISSNQANSFLRKCLSAAPKPITSSCVKTTLNNLNSISGLKISQVKSLREDEDKGTPVPKPIINTVPSKNYSSTTPTKLKPSTSFDDTTEYGYYIADHASAPKVFAKKTEDSITLKTPAVEDGTGSRIVRVKMESGVIRYLNDYIFRYFKLSPTNWRFLKINKKEAKNLLSPFQQGPDLLT